MMAKRASKPNHMTVPFWLFNDNGRDLLSFFMLATRLALATDVIKGKLKKREMEKWRPLLGAEFAIAREMNKYNYLQDRLVLSTQADNFLVYLADLLALIFRTRPETLRSSETVRLDIILQHQTMDDLISELVERRVHQLSYQGMQDVSEYVADRLGFELFTTKKALGRAIQIIEFRNLFVHNRGVANQRFVSRNTNFKARLGQRIQLTPKFIAAECSFLHLSAYDIDQRAAGKFGLPTEERERIIGSIGLVRP